MPPATRASDPCLCGTMARISMVSPPVHVAQVPISSIMIMHEGLLRDCVRKLCLLKEHYISKRPLLLIYDFQPISMHLDMFNIVIVPYLVL